MNKPKVLALGLSLSAVFSLSCIAAEGSAADGERAAQSVNIELGGKDIVLDAEDFNGGNIYAAFYSPDDTLSSVKVIPAGSGTMHIEPDADAAYAKVMWWNDDMLPNCETETVELKEYYPVNYNIANGDNYLATINPENPNAGYYTSEDGLTLADLAAPEGYVFLGWYTAPAGGERVTRIEPGTTGSINLYAQWNRNTYSVYFVTDMVSVDPITYTAGEEIPLPTPSLDKYIFVGWSDAEGNYWDKIPAGTSGNITLYSNWSSQRNHAIPVSELDDPLICEDPDAGLILFTYELGEIRNVPLFTTLNLNCADGVITTISETDTKEISGTRAKEIAKTISKATTDSSTWTLSSEWNQTTQVNESTVDQNQYTLEEAETLAKSSSGPYTLSSGIGGSSSVANTENGSFRLTGTNSGSDSSTTEDSEEFGLSVDASVSAGVSAGVSIPLGIGSADVGSSLNFDLGAGIDYTENTSSSKTSTNGWESSAELSSAYSSTSTNEKNWNTSTGYSSSQSTSSTNSISSTISNLISKTYGYGKSYSEGGANSQAQSFASTDSKENAFSAAVTYYNSEIKTYTHSLQTTGETHGSYRMLMAGTMHVFAVIGYDISTATYFTYTYNVLDDDTYEYFDYSYDGSFSDYETSCLPFEIPYFVNEYVNSRVARTNGFVFNPDTGVKC